MTVSEDGASARGDDIRRLGALVLQMGRRVEAEFRDAVRALMRRRSRLAERVIAADLRVDALNREIETLGVEILALRQPVAVDLRVVVASLRIAVDLKRIGNCAQNVARGTIALNETPAVQLAATVPRIAEVVGSMLADVLAAYETRDVEVDAMYHDLFSELVGFMIEDPRGITSCTDILLIAKNVERVGDHGTNIAEAIYFIVHGVPMPEPRPTG